MPEGKGWIAFCAQGAGASENTVHLAEIRLLHEKLDAGGFVNVTEIVALAKVETHCLVAVGKLFFDIISAFDRTEMKRMIMRSEPSGGPSQGRRI